MESIRTAIVIPLYRNELTGDENKSIERCYSLWSSKYDIYFVKPVTVTLSKILEQFPNVRTVSFDPSFFKGKRGYNKLMLSPLFYEKFLDYTYIFIYQADGYAFRDELHQWCEKGYDYIGSPWIPREINSRWWYGIYRYARGYYYRFKSHPDRSIQYYQVGNGGVSLRKTTIFYKVAREDREKIVSFIKRLGSSSMFNEDVYWSFEAKTATGNRLSKPGYKEALEFGFDMNPDVSYRLNGNRLPFCCHGFSHRRHRKFWQKFI